jgi:putative MATE family efflux protein
MKRILELIKLAIKGDETIDYTGISLNKALILLSIPMLIEMVFESLFALADAFFVSKYIGINGIATVGLTESVLTIIYSLAWGISIASTAIISRKIGENNAKDASKALMQIINISVVIGIILSVTGYLFSEKIMLLMGASDEVIRDGLWYTKIQFLSTPIIILLFSLGGALRGAGNASKAMNVMIVANIINIILDFAFVVLIKYGVAGAAIATMIGRGIGVIIQLYFIFSHKHKLNIDIINWHFDLPHIWEIIKMSVGGAGQFIIQSASWVFLIRILSGFGSEVVGGYTIAIRLIVFTILPSWGIANAASTLVGQNLGAGKPDRASSSAWRAGYFNMVFLGIVAVFYFIYADPLVRIFSDNEKAIETAILSLKILCSGYIFFGFGMVMTQAINGSGDTYTPTVLNIISFWLIEIPLAYLLAIQFKFNEPGVFWAIVISESLLAILAMIYFKTGRWKKNKLAF